MSRLIPLVSLLGLLFLAGTGFRADEEKKSPFSDKVVEKIASTAKKSIAVITVTGRDGKREGLGTGFVIAADGLIATNLHVIGDARPISVQLADGKSYDVTSVHATDRAADLAILRIDAKELTPLPLGDSSKLPQGAGVVALGNPLGLERSIVAGLVSGQREIDGRNMIQLAMPVERGNSGGPVVDLEGRVQGIVTMKSAVADNLGFAVPINALKPLLEKPNPVAMARWLTIGALDADDWQVLFGARWRQRAGRITVEGLGAGFGGRSLCLSKRAAPELPFEIAVTVKLDNESGAAGLVFHADGKDKHYGFYATGGGLRLTRFDGPDVFTWKILHQDKSPHYRAGNWNMLKVRIEKEKLLCYVNGQQVFESNDDVYTSGQVGLAKFRDTRAEFKGFLVGKKIEGEGLPGDVLARINKEIGKLDPDKALKSEVIDKLAPDAKASVALLRDRARQLEQQADQLRKLAAAVHGKRVTTELLKTLDSKEADIDLVHAALLIARLDNDELDVEAYRAEVERMARKLTAELPKDADDKAKLEGLQKFLFRERGYHGSRGENYYSRSNSYLNEVIDDREGIPITLSVLYMDLGRRIGVRLEGVGLPGHFVVRHLPKEGEPQMIDVFEGGLPLSREDAEKKARAITGRPLLKEHLMPTTKRAIIVRMLHNLLNVARGERDGESMLRYVDAIIALTPEATEDRWLRAQLRYHAGQKQGSLEDVEWLLDKGGDGIDREQLLELRKLLKREE
jgi:serine protease Do